MTSQYLIKEPTLVSKQGRKKRVCIFITQSLSPYLVKFLNWGRSYTSAELCMGIVVPMQLFLLRIFPTHQCFFPYLP